jgi:hypothetical protein
MLEKQQKMMRQMVNMSPQQMEKMSSRMTDPMGYDPKKK